MSNKTVDHKLMLKAITEHDVAVELNALLFSQALGIKKDPISEFIAKFIYTEHQKGNFPNVSLIENTLHESPNTIRKKINTLIGIGFVETVKSDKDARSKCYKPTELLEKVYLVDMTKRIKCLLELVPSLDDILGKDLAIIFEAIGTNHHDSYLHTQDSYSFNKLIEIHNLELLKEKSILERVKNTLNNLG